MCILMMKVIILSKVAFKISWSELEGDEYDNWMMFSGQWKKSTNENFFSSCLKKVHYFFSDKYFVFLCTFQFFRLCIYIFMVLKEYNSYLMLIGIKSGVYTFGKKIHEGSKCHK